MQALDTNVLVHAEVVSSPHHSKARKILIEKAEGDVPWAIPWPCVYEFLRIVTHPRIYHPPMPVIAAVRELRQILASPSLVLLAETYRHAEVLESILIDSGASGNLMHDAHIAALCVEHGAREILTGDRDFARFKTLTVINPFAP